MTISSQSAGSQTAVIDTEHTLATITGIGTYTLSLDLNALASGDLLTVRIKNKVGTGGTTRLAYQQSYSGAQTEAVVFSVPIPSLNEVVFTVEQTAGTGRVIPWEIIEI